MIDLHAHPLPAVDDGVPTIDAALDLVAAAGQAGVTVLAATPHVSERFPTTVETMRAATDELRALCGGRGTEIVTGGEVAISWLARLSDDDLRGFTLGGSGRYLLVELPPSGWSFGSELVFSRLKALGIRPVIAHPERHHLIRERPDRLLPLIEDGAILQVTARALTRRASDRASAAAARALVERGLAQIVASDVHGVRTDGRSPWDADLPDRTLEDLWVTVPAAILAGAEVARPRLKQPLVRRLLRR